jgi:hypothetical protein
MDNSNKIVQIDQGISKTTTGNSFFSDSKNVWLTVVFIVILILIIYYIYKSNWKTEDSINKEIINKEIINKEIINNITTQPTPAVQTEKCPEVQKCAAQEELPKTKQIYSKYEEINLPSSIGGNNGYIGRDYVCYRKKIGDQSFVSKRTGCMACQVGDNTDKYDDTGTNVISTCVYSDNVDDNDPDVWTKQMCINKCAKIENTYGN